MFIHFFLPQTWVRPVGRSVKQPNFGRRRRSRHPPSHSSSASHQVFRMHATSVRSVYSWCKTAKLWSKAKLRSFGLSYHYNFTYIHSGDITHHHLRIISLSPKQHYIFEVILLLKLQYFLEMTLYHWSTTIFSKWHNIFEVTIFISFCPFFSARLCRPISSILWNGTS